MRAPVSVIIPTLDAEAALPGCLGALFEGLEAGVIRELIVVDGGSGDATMAMAERAGAQVISVVPSRGGQLRAGAEVAQGDWLLFVHADTRLGQGWSATAMSHVTGARQAGYFNLRFDAGGVPARLVAGWANLRSRVMGLPYGDQGLLISRQMYDAVGGFEAIPLMEDVAMARALRGQLTRLDGVAVTSAERYCRSGWLRRGARNLWTLARYFAGVSPEKLVADYRK